MEKVEEKKLCSDCSKEHPMSALTENGNIFICTDCMDNYFTCNNCNSLELNDDMSEMLNRDIICAECVRNDVTGCRGCDGLMYSNNTDTSCRNCNDTFCSDCLENHTCESENEIPNRPINTETTKYQSSTLGAVVLSPRKWSAEIECTYNDNSDAQNLASDIPKEIGISEDGSISGDNIAGGLELQTPILQGQAGEALIHTVSKALERNNFSVNATCGLHLHLDGGSEYKTQQGNNDTFRKSKISDLITFYLLFEDVIYSFLPQSRRISNYCKSLRLAYHAEELKNVRTLSGLEKIWYRERASEKISQNKSDKWHNSRYYGANFHCLLAFGHFEIRYHSGTLSARKILEWANLHTAIMDSVPNIRTDVMYQKSGTVSLIEKTDNFFSLLKITPESAVYWKARQAKFTPLEAKNLSESEIVSTIIPNPTAICAE